MKSLKLVVSLILIAVLALSITGCGKDGSLVSKVETYDEPTGGNMKINPMKNVDLNVESYEANETEIDLSPIGQAKLALSDNITTYDMAKIEDIPQEKLDAAIEKKDNLLLDLKNKFKSKGISVSIDEANGDIALDAAILFDRDKSEVSAEGKAFLKEFLPIYLSVLFCDDYTDFISEIVIEGHTDTDGSYDYNKKLSQERADNVKTFCVSSESGLSDINLKEFKNKVSSKGFSYDRPIKDSNGNVDKDASRRVSFRFLINLD